MIFQRITRKNIFIPIIPRILRNQKGLFSGKNIFFIPSYPKENITKGKSAQLYNIFLTAETLVLRRIETTLTLASYQPPHRIFSEAFLPRFSFVFADNQSSEYDRLFRKYYIIKAQRERNTTPQKTTTL